MSARTWGFESPFRTNISDFETLQTALRRGFRFEEPVYDEPSKCASLTDARPRFAAPDGSSGRRRSAGRCNEPARCGRRRLQSGSAAYRAATLRALTRRTLGYSPPHDVRSLFRRLAAACQPWLADDTLRHRRRRPDRLRRGHPDPAVLCRVLWRIGNSSRSVAHFIRRHAVSLCAGVGTTLRPLRSTPGHAVDHRRDGPRANGSGAGSIACPGSSWPASSAASSERISVSRRRTSPTLRVTRTAPSTWGCSAHPLRSDLSLGPAIGGVLAPYGYHVPLLVAAGLAAVNWILALRN